MNIDIENINIIEKRHKHYKKQRRKIYKVVEQEFFDETENFRIYILNIVRIM